MTYRVQVHATLKTGSETVMAFSIDAETHGRATIQARKTVQAQPDVKKVTMVTWAAE